MPSRTLTSGTVLVLDFGAQYAQLIARVVREAHVTAEVLPHHTPTSDILRRHPAGIILSGGPDSVYAEGAPALDPEILHMGIPVLGICYGAQLIAKHLGGAVVGTTNSEYGRTVVEVLGHPSALLNGEPEIKVWMSHSDSVVGLPDDFRVTAKTRDNDVAAFENPTRQVYGVQFHPEVTHTDGGDQIIGRFVFDVCHCKPTWSPESFIEASVLRTRQLVGAERVLCALSGGVDSAVAAALAHKAVGDQLTCIFVDTGLLRLGEAERTKSIFREYYGSNFVSIDASARFLERLRNVRDPERKRKIIGKTFIRIFEEFASTTGARFLVQGTLHSDFVESGSTSGANIKSHHNVGGLPKRMRFTLIEPLRDIFKDEARLVGEELGLPRDILWRQPFPGPGLAVRIIGSVTRERVHTLQAADEIIVDEVRKAGLYHELWQSFGVLPAVRTVGVMGDGRTYGYPIVIRAVTSRDAMTADWARLPYDLVERISTRICNEVDDVNRVVLDVTSKPPGTIEWE